MNSTAVAQNASGRLVEYYLRQREMTHEELAIVSAELTAAVKSAVRHTGKIVVIADLRELPVLGPNMADYIMQVMRNDNQYMLCSAVLCSPHATFGMQIDRVMRDSGRHAERRRVTSEEECLAWLGEVLQPDELARLTTFLRSGP